jgi:hypothetical protein
MNAVDWLFAGGILGAFLWICFCLSYMVQL